MPVSDFEKVMEEKGVSKFVPAFGDIKNDLRLLFRRNSSGLRVFESYIGPAAVFFYEPGKLKIVRTNDMMIDMLGFRELFGVEFSRSFDDGIAQEDRAAVKAAVARAVEGENGSVYIFGYTRPDGKKIIVRGRLWYLGISDDLPLVYTVCDDVTNVMSFRNGA
jgi:hypothetical protein